MVDSSYQQFVCITQALLLVYVYTYVYSYVYSLYESYVNAECRVSLAITSYSFHGVVSAARI